MAAWCLGFAAVNIAFQVTGRFASGPYAEMAPGLAVMDWIVVGLKLLGAAVALLATTTRTATAVRTVLIWGAFGLLGLYSAGNIVELVVLLVADTGVIELRSLAYGVLPGRGGRIWRAGRVLFASDWRQGESRSHRGSRGTAGARRAAGRRACGADRDGAAPDAVTVSGSGAARPMRGVAQRRCWMRSRLPAGSRTAQSRTPYGCSIGSWTISAPLACTCSKVLSRSAVARSRPA